MNKYRIVLKRTKANFVNQRHSPVFIRRWFPGNTLDEAKEKALTKFPDCDYQWCLETKILNEEKNARPKEGE